MAKITEEMVRHVALLSRLSFSPDELKYFTFHLNSILEYVETLNELDTSGVEPTSHSLRMSNIFREDIVTPSLPNQEALSNAPEKEEQCFKVPRVIQEY